MAEQFERSVSDDLVGVHVRRSAGAALDHVYRKMLVQLASDDLLASGGDGFCPFPIEYAEFRVRGCRGFLHKSQRADKVLKMSQRNSGERKILHASQGLHAVVGCVG